MVISLISQNLGPLLYIALMRCIKKCSNDKDILYPHTALITLFFLPLSPLSLVWAGFRMNNLISSRHSRDILFVIFQKVKYIVIKEEGGGYN